MTFGRLVGWLVYCWTDSLASCERVAMLWWQGLVTVWRTERGSGSGERGSWTKDQLQDGCGDGNHFRDALLRSEHRDWWVALIHPVTCSLQRDFSSHLTMKIAQYFAIFHWQIVNYAVFHRKDIVCFLAELSSFKTTFGVYMYSM